MVAFRQSANELTGDEWNLGELTGLSADDFCTWAKTDTMGHYRHAYLAMDKCVGFERELWFYLGKCTWRKHQSVYHEDLNYIRNYILKPF